MLFGTLGHIVLANMLLGKDEIPGPGLERADEGTIRAGKYFQSRFIFN